MSNSQIKRTFYLTKKVGIKTYSFNMIGIPFETPTTAQETINLNGEINPDFLQVSIFYPSPQTDIYKLCEKIGFLTNKHKGSHFEEGSILNQPTITSTEINKYFNILRVMPTKRK